MSINWKPLLAPILSFAASAGALALAGKGAKYETIAQTAVKSAVTTVDNGADKLLAMIEKYEAGDEVAVQAVNTFMALATAAGITLPALDVIEAHVKAAIYDLATIIVPAGQLAKPNV